jgi:phosphate transport system substrate-binding protein
MLSTRRNLALMVLVVLVVGLLSTVAAGCGGEIKTPGEATTTTAAKPTTTAAGGTTTTAGATSTTAGAKVSLTGAGATFPGPLYLEWIGEFQTSVKPNVSINYQGIGSGGGIQQFTKLTVDFGASDAPMKDEEITAAEAASGAKVLHIPTVFGAVVLAYNLPEVAELKLDPDTLAAIFMGEITKWNDSRLTALNPDAKLPDKAIQSIHRSDSSGTTNIFTGYLAAVSQTWSDKVGKGKEVKWPVGLGGQGNDGVTAVIKQQSGSIGYVELSYAIQSKLASATLKNKAGNFVKPTLASTSAAAVGVKFPEDLRFSLSNSEGKDAYPIVGATWILAYDKMKDAAKAQALKDWLVWALNDGAAIAEDLGYAVLPQELKDMAMAKVDLIK